MIKEYAIDSCMVFKFININNLNCKNIAHLEVYKKLMEKNQIIVINKMLELCDKYKVKYENFGFYNELKNHITTEIHKRKERIRKNEKKYLIGYIVDENDQSRIVKRFSVEEKREAFQMNKIFKEELAQVKLDLCNLVTLNESITMMNQYLELFPKYAALMKNEIKYVITPTVWKEIKNHIFEFVPVEERKDNNIYFSYSQLQNLLSKGIKYKKFNKQELNQINILSKKYRDKTDISQDEKPMKNDRNSLNIFGDSIIMAEASVANIPLITQNVNDFIIDSGKDYKNETIRNFIKRINNHFFKRESIYAFAPSEI